MSKVSDQKGFAHLLLLLVIFVLVVIIGTGYFVWNKQRGNTGNSTDKNQSAAKTYTQRHDIGNTGVSFGYPDGWTVTEDDRFTFHFYPRGSKTIDGTDLRLTPKDVPEEEKDRRSLYVSAYTSVPDFLQSYKTLQIIAPSNEISYTLQDGEKLTRLEYSPASKNATESLKYVAEMGDTIIVLYGSKVHQVTGENDVNRGEIYDNSQYVEDYDSIARSLHR